jgi:hypothetical protein
VTVVDAHKRADLVEDVLKWMWHGAHVPTMSL